MERYEFIRRWGRYMNWSPSAIDRVIAQAESESAPMTARFKRSYGDYDWATIDNLTDPGIIESLDLHYHTVESNLDTACSRCGVTLAEGISKFCEGATACNTPS